MNKRERIDAAIHRQPVDRPPVALWRHFPGDDLDAEKFARRVIEFQKEYDFDLVKVTPAASYVAEMYGAQLDHAGNREGTRSHTTRVIRDWRDWSRVESINRDNPVFQREREALRRIRAELGKNVPILQTIFTPLSCARTLAGERLVKDLREHPGEVTRALQHLGTTMERFALDSIAAGADSFFLATQVATRETLTPEELRAFSQTYDLTLINELRGQAHFTLLHVHGENIYFDEMSRYPVQVINWHDRKTPPSLKEGKGQFHGAVAGGIEEWGVLQTTPESITAQIHEAIRQTQGVGFIAAAGCVIPIDTPAETIRAARLAVELQPSD